MQDKIRNIKKKFETEIALVKDKKSLFSFEKKFLGRRGILKLLFDELKNLSLEEKKIAGPLLNKIKEEFFSKINFLKDNLGQDNIKKEVELDLTLPQYSKSGFFNPLVQVSEKIQETFLRLGFSIYDSAHVETDYYNFTSLNIPEMHPARDMWNTFYIKSKVKTQNTENSKYTILRTHTTAFQARALKDFKPPFKFINIGRCFRYEPVDKTHNTDFNQVDGLIVSKDINLSNFVDILYNFFEEIFESKLDIKISPSYFPFVEPGFELSIKRKNDDKFLEVMGAGFSHPNVIKNAGLDSKVWKGIAFGMGIERIAMIYYKIDDIRYFYSQDLRVFKNIQ